MDEIIIDEKKYVSSKRAAKLTGYAKDYIGQLCREGRVPARLVGRSWYVLESAIQDHRFSAQKPESEDKSSKKEDDSHLKLQSTWESPRYEAATAEILPSINRLRNTDYKASLESKNSPEEPVSEIDEADKFQIQVPEEEKKMEPILPDPPSPDNLTTVGDEDEVTIPIHTLYELPPEDLLPKPLPLSNKRVESIQSSKAQEPRKRIGIVSAAVTLLKLVAIFLAFVSVLIAAVGTGYLDKILASHNRATQVTGIGTYIK